MGKEEQKYAQEIFEIKEIQIDFLDEMRYEKLIKQNVFVSYEWIEFLKKNGKGKPVILGIYGSC